MTGPTRRQVAQALAAAPLALALPARAATEHAVAIKGFAFDPKALTVAVGDKVTFTNMDSAAHSVTADNGAFDSGKLTKGKSFTIAFAAKGSFPYHCKFHGSMKALVTVA